MKATDWLRTNGRAELGLVATLAAGLAVIVMAVPEDAYAAVLSHLIGAALGVIAVTMAHWSHAAHLGDEITYPNAISYLAGAVVGAIAVALVHSSLMQLPTQF